MRSLPDERIQTVPHELLYPHLDLPPDPILGLADDRTVRALVPELIVRSRLTRDTDA